MQKSHKIHVLSETRTLQAVHSWFQKLSLVEILSPPLIRGKYFSTPSRSSNESFVSQCSPKCVAIGWTHSSSNGIFVQGEVSDKAYNSRCKASSAQGQHSFVCVHINKISVLQNIFHSDFSAYTEKCWKIWMHEQVSQVGCMSGRNNRRLLLGSFFLKRHPSTSY